MINPKQVGNYNVCVEAKIEYSAPKTYIDSIISFLESAYGGPFQFMQLCDKLCKVLSLTTEHTKLFKEAGKLCQGGWAMTALPHIPASFLSAKKTVDGLRNHGFELSTAFYRKSIAAMREISKTVSGVGYALTPFMRLSEKTQEIAGEFFAMAEGLKVIGDASSLVENSHDLQMSWILSSQANETSDVDPIVREALTETCRLNMIKTAKTLCSAAGLVLGLSVVSTSLAGLPFYALGVASISLLGTALNIGVSLYSDQMKYKQIQFMNPNHIQELNQAAKPQNVISEETLSSEGLLLA